MSERVSAWAPPMKPPTPVKIEDPSWYHRRVLRSLKKVFQLRWSGIVASAAEGEGEATVEAKRIEVGDLNCTFRFGRDTRRLLREVVSVRRGV